jgi:hypothetical protein
MCFLRGTDKPIELSFKYKIDQCIRSIIVIVILFLLSVHSVASHFSFQLTTGVFGMFGVFGVFGVSPHLTLVSGLHFVSNGFYLNYICIANDFLVR